jgi:UTP--glucose-1-phosphate uridylyltransferase
MPISRKAGLHAMGFGTRSLPATRAMPREFLPVIDQPIIQCAFEETVEAGIDTMIVATGRNKRALEDLFDANAEG